MLKLYLLSAACLLATFAMAQYAVPDTLGVRELHVKGTQIIEHTGELITFDEAYYYDTTGLLTQQQVSFPYELKRWQFSYDKQKRLTRMEQYYNNSLSYYQQYTYYGDILIERTHNVKHNSNSLRVIKTGDFLPMLSLDDYQLEVNWKTDSVEHYISIVNNAKGASTYVPDTGQYFLTTTSVTPRLKVDVGVMGADTVLHRNDIYDSLARLLSVNYLTGGYLYNTNWIYGTDTTTIISALDTTYHYTQISATGDTNRIYYSVKERRNTNEVLTDKNGRLLKTLLPDYSNPYNGGTKWRTTEYTYTGRFLTGITQTLNDGQGLWETTTKKMEYTMY